jgi:GntR family transcriptional regulator of arabinose operon
MMSDPVTVSFVASPKRENPKYRQLAQQIKQRIESRELRPGDRVPSFTEMRELYGVSQSTLERAHALLEEEGLIRREVGRGTFINPRHERTLKGIIGFHSGGAALQDSPYWHAILAGMRQTLLLHQFQVLLLDGGDGWDKVDGVVLATTPTFPVPFPLGNLPCVGLLYKEWEEELQHQGGQLAGIVAIDDQRAGSQATEHLLALGHQKIACLLSPVLLREVGYREALERSNIAYDKRWLRYFHDVPLADFRSVARQEMQLWLQEDWHELGCTALLAQNDEAAIGAIEVLQEAGLDVPGDISVIGFDGTEITSYFRPQLTTVEIPLLEIGKNAALMMVQHLTGQRAVSILNLSTQVRVRASTAAPARSAK